MAVTVEQLRESVGKRTGAEMTLASDLEAADVLLIRYVGTAYSRIPSVIYDKAHLAVATEMWNQREAPNGFLNQVYDTADGGQLSTPVRIGADPLRPAYGLLKSWVRSKRGLRTIGLTGT